MLSDTAEFVYKCSDVYNPNPECCVQWNDEVKAGEWPKLDGEYKISEKDEMHEPFSSQDFCWTEKWL